MRNTNSVATPDRFDVRISDVTRGGEHLAFTATLEWLAAAHSNNLSLYATPNQKADRIVNTYWANSAKWQNDVRILDAIDFIAITHGYDEGAFEYEQVQAMADENYTLNYSRFIMNVNSEDVETDEFGIRWTTIDDEKFELFGPDEEQNGVAMHNSGYIPTTLTRGDMGDSVGTVYENETLFIKKA